MTSGGSEPRYARPVPTIGDTSSAAQRRDDPTGWAMGEAVTEALAAVVAGRRDIRRYRPDAVPEELITAVLEAGHRAPSVGHSQPWRFVVVSDPATRDRAAAMADRARVDQAAHLASERAARMLDLKLEGLREAPVGIVVACDRRTPATGVLGRATFPDADLWSCATAIENMWLTARAHGLGMGWVTLFDPDELADLLGLPEGVVTLGWLCLGWPDERPPSPGLERVAWSKKTPLEQVVLHDRWPADEAAPQQPVSHLRGPEPTRLVGATDAADELLSPPESLGVLDRALNRVLAVGAQDVTGGTLVLAGADHPVTGLGVSAFPATTTHDVLAATVAGTSLGAATAKGAGLAVVGVDAGVAQAVPGAHKARPAGERGDLATTDAMTLADVEALVAAGRDIGTGAAVTGLVCLGEVGVGNTTVAAALACALLDLEPQDAVGLGSGSDADMVARKHDVVSAALARTQGESDPLRLLAMVGGPEIALLTGVTLGAAAAGAPVVLDGLAGSLPGVIAARLEPAAQAYLLAGQVSRERAHALVLRELGLEPLLDLRLRAGEGVGACLAASMLLQGLAVRRIAARTR
ncbi:5,6-dimethylbenzimidazole synthase [Janibacter hoylei]|uniref:5,6-dimethylbenzimidazole synthase n=1 Tax=Janibacter hoylei TaxID=364298 RepID=UPI0021A8AB7D|nr:5,6-dimethylbenzimidazole synthase [Janibacter hoylei]MCT1619004.1 5,6-dimethylbenzimidazole synthase [Janibacter hoylei]MCT2291950.1 5,6-dimethylbenzimidazole synthase [Janibacter hoylei]MCW4602778.1 5,6-dimethylbenzimidazole synthase [Janibacter hoylei]